MTREEWLSALRVGSLLFLSVVGFFGAMALISWFAILIGREERKDD